MATALGLDFSYARPTPAQIKSVGYAFAMRYLSWEFATPQSVGKNITKPEMDSYHAAGLSVGFVWESLADRALGGAANGAADGAEAGRQLDALGVPRSIPVFWALDVDDRGYWNPMPTLKAYGDAFARACGHFSFPYGSNRVIDYFGGGWQTQAWSDDFGRAVSQHAFLYQRSGGSRIPDTDENVLMNAYALWAPDNAAAVAAYLKALAEQKAVAAYLASLAAAAKKKPKLSATGYPNITAFDHTHPKALAELKRKLVAVNPKADVSTDAATIKTVEGFRKFFGIKDPAPRVGDGFWQALDYLATLDK